MASTASPAPDELNELLPGSDAQRLRAALSDYSDTAGHRLRPRWSFLVPGVACAGMLLAATVYARTRKAPRPWLTAWDPSVSVLSEGKGEREGDAGVDGCAAGAAYAAGLHAEKVDVSGLQRDFLVYQPRLSTRRPVPVMLVLPGSGGGGDPYKFDKWPDLVQFSEREQFSIVVLSGIKHTWNVWLNSLPRYPAGPDEVAYAKEVLLSVESKLCIDRRRVFCFGASGGGRVCDRFASELSDVFAAVGLVSAVRYPKPNHASRAVPLIAFHGTADQTNPYWGGKTYWGPASVPEEISKWSEFDGCKSLKNSSPKAGVQIERHENCTDNAAVTLVTLEGVQHVWFGDRNIWSGDLSKTDIVNVTKLTWEFFRAHPLQQLPKNFWSSE